MAKPDEQAERAKPIRMDPENVFQFNCASGVPCYTQCCQDVTIVLTPYDAVRLKNALRISSDVFLDKYALIVAKEDRLIPLVMLKMNEENKKCPFVTDKGCRVYAHRPWPCRMFPLDMNDDGTLRPITDAGRCLGLDQDVKARIGDWLVEQGVPIYDEMNSLFSEITNPLRAQDMDIDNPKIYKMVFMALYNLDKFRDFLFQSTFLDRFDVAPERIEKIKRNDIELMKFAFDWIKFGIFGQKTLFVKPETSPSHS